MLIALVWVAAFLVILFIRGDAKSIPHAIVFVIVFPILPSAMALAALMVFGESANSERPRHVERATR